MACNVTTGFVTDCSGAVGGVIELFLANYPAFDSGVTEDPTTLEIDALPTATVYRYVGLRNSMSYDEVLTSNPDNGTTYFVQTVTVRLGSLTAAKRKEIQNLATAKLMVFARTAENKIVMLGRFNGAYATAGTAGAGKLKGDFSGYELTFTAEEQFMGYFLQQFATNPFDNFLGITVSPAY